MEVRKGHFFKRPGSDEVFPEQQMNTQEKGERAGARMGHQNLFEGNFVAAPPNQSMAIAEGGGRGALMPL